MDELLNSLEGASIEAAPGSPDMAGSANRSLVDASMERR